jgi:hypothetical protein
MKDKKVRNPVSKVIGVSHGLTDNNNHGSYTQKST